MAIDFSDLKVGNAELVVRVPFKLLGSEEADVSAFFSRAFAKVRGNMVDELEHRDGCDDSCVVIHETFEIDLIADLATDLDITQVIKELLALGDDSDEPLVISETDGSESPDYDEMAGRLENADVTPSGPDGVTIEVPHGVTPDIMTELILRTNAETDRRLRKSEQRLLREYHKDQPVTAAA